MAELEDTPCKDRIPLWPLWAAIGFPVLLIALEASPIAPNFAFVMLGLPGMLFLWASLGLWALVVTFQSLWRRAWQRAAMSAILPLVMISVGVHPTAFLRFCNNAGDTVHFYVRYPAYRSAVRATPTNGGPKLLTFNLGGMIWASRGFVYDESDEVMRAPSLQSAKWKARAQDSELGCGYGAIPVPGPAALARHWYIASFAC
jgi:hypothetical protein